MSSDCLHLFRESPGRVTAKLNRPGFFFVLMRSEYMRNDILVNA